MGRPEPAGSTFEGGRLRTLLFVVVALQWSCGVADLVLTSYFASKYGMGLHLMFGIIIGSISVYTYFGYMFYSFIRIYKGYFLLTNIIFSHLWLTYFIFNALDYNSTRGCEWGEPRGNNQCAVKYTLEALSFATFFFTLCAIPVDLQLYIRENFVRRRRMATPIISDPIPMGSGAIVA